MTSAQQRKIFGQKVKQHREDRGWLQQELARRVGVTPSAVSNVEQGIRGASEAVVVALEDTFELPRGELGSMLGQAPTPVTQSPEDAIEADASIPPEHKRPLRAHLAEIRRVIADNE